MFVSNLQCLISAKYLLSKVRILHSCHNYSQRKKNIAIDGKVGSSFEELFIKQFGVSRVRVFLIVCFGFVCCIARMLVEISIVPRNSSCLLDDDKLIQNAMLSCCRGVFYSF